MVGKRIAVVTRALARAFLPALVACALAPPAGAVTLRANSSTVSAPGDQAQICIALETEGSTVAGTQNDLEWDTSCASLPNKASCVVNEQHGKQLQSAMPKGDRFGALARLRPVAERRQADRRQRALLLHLPRGDEGTRLLRHQGHPDRRQHPRRQGARHQGRQRPALLRQGAVRRGQAGRGSPAAAAAKASGGSGGGSGWFGCQVAPASGLSPLLQILVTGFAFALLRRRRT